jgi:F-type H+-transporting ATPase subunit delta
MSYDSIGRRYAKALFEIGKEEGSLAALSSQITAFAQIYASNEELRLALDNPLVTEDAKRQIVVEIGQRLGFGQTASRALRLVTERRRLRVLPDIAKHLGLLVDVDANVERASVVSAVPLSEAYLRKLRTELERSTGKKVELTQSIDPSLIAGVVAKVGDRVIDGSLRARLAGFRHARFELESS